MTVTLPNARNLLKGIISRLSQLAKPPPLVSPWQWAEENRTLPTSAAEGGKMRFDRTPWVRWITDAIANLKYQEVITTQGSQLGKTETLINTIGWQLHYRHKPCMYFAPTEDNAKAISHRIFNMFNNCESLKNGLDKKRSSMFETHIYGTRFGISWAGSKTGVASHSVELAVADELDRWEVLTREGNPWDLIKARTISYHNPTIVGTSSPTLAPIVEFKHPETGLYHWQYIEPEYVVSLIWELWQEGTRQEFMIPCPHCLQYFAPKSKLLKWPDTTVLGMIERETYLVCPHCGKAIKQRYQHEMLLHGLMLAPGQWVENGQVQGDLIDTKIASFHVNGLLSPWRTWGQRAVEYSRALESKNTSRIQVIVNTSFGECFDVEANNSVSWEVIASKRETGWTLGTLPEEVMFQAFTGFADVQGDRLVYAVCGWAHNENKLEMYLIQAGELYGNTFEQEVWDQFIELMEQKYGGLPVRQWGVDSGYNPSKSKRAKKASLVEGESMPRNMIYEFVRMHGRRILMTKGSPRPLNRPWSKSLVDVSIRGRLVKSGLDLWTIDTDYFKSEVMAKLKWDEEKPGRWHFPEDTPDEFFIQLCSEYKDENNRWVKKDENHFLDCMVGNVFLATREGLTKKKPMRPLRQRKPKRRRESDFDGFGGFN